jgi:hypothetical protein
MAADQDKIGATDGRGSTQIRIKSGPQMDADQHRSG